MSSIRVLIADDHKIIRDGLKAMINKEAGMEVIAEAENGHEAVRLAQKLHPNVVVMDGIEATRKITEEAPGVRIIALSMHSGRNHVLGMLEAGASGYLLKDCAFEELTTAIRKVKGGNTYVSPRIAEVVVKGYLVNKAPVSFQASRSVLTPRECDVLQLLAEGRTTKEIAFRLNVAVKKVETHRRNLMFKLKMRSIAELTKYAILEGLVSIES